MLNAHLRFGWLSVVRDTGKSFRVRLDRLIAERASSRYEIAKAHLISVLGGDTQIAAISAALSDGKTFTIQGPEVAQVDVSFRGEKPRTYRASIQVPGRKRALRHLVAVSEQLTTGLPKLVLADSSPDFVWRAVCESLGLPGTPAWADWFDQQLKYRKSATSLIGIGCSPALITPGRDAILSWLGEAVASGALDLPSENRAISWPATTLQQLFQLESENSVSPAGSTIPLV